MIAQLNSKLLGYYHKTKNSDENKAFAQFKGVYIEGFPYVENTNEIFQILVERNILLVENLRESLNTFTKYLQSQFSIEKLSKKIQNWHDLDFADFIKELNKAIKKAGGDKLSKMDEMEWMEVFETKKAEAQAIKTEIDKTDKEIDQMVYELYGLTDEEITIVEGGV
jgi:predicted transcriptional regulator